MGTPCEAQEYVAGQGNIDGGGRRPRVRRRQRRREATTAAVRMEGLGLTRVGVVLTVWALDGVCRQEGRHSDLPQ